MHLKNKITDLLVENLWKHTDVLNYLLKERRLTSGSIKKFKLGYCCDNIIFNFAKENNFIKEVKDLGLLNGSKDRYNGFIIFPVLDGEDTVSFYGRSYSNTQLDHLLPDGVSKTFPYNKNALDNSSVIIVESPIDAITLDQHNFKAVAIFGNKIPREMAEHFRKKKVYIIFDTDEAGKIGAKVSATILLNTARQVHIITFPGKYGKKMDANSYFIQFKTAPSIIKTLVEKSCPLNKRLFTYKEKKEKKLSNKVTGRIKNYEHIRIINVGKKLFNDYKEQNGSILVRCPHHQQGNETKRSLWIGGKKNIFYCFGCCKGGDAITLVAWHFNLSLEDAMDWLDLNGF